jgi:polysaccharide biosynthesis/export protein
MMLNNSTLSDTSFSNERERNNFPLPLAALPNKSEPYFLRLVKQIWILGTFGLLLVQVSCVEHKQLVNFRQAPDPLVYKSLAIPTMPAHLIQADDQLSISIHSLDPEAVAPLNLTSGISNSGRQNSGGTIGNQLASETVGIGYLVDRDGNIDMPVIGRLKVAGLTIQQLKDTILTKVLKYVTDPIVNIRYLNFRFTVLGEVLRPGTYVLGNESISLLEALGIAGDITTYGNRTNILIIRSEGGQQLFHNIDLTTQDVFSSPYFFLHKNDYIYVEPIKEKVASVADPSIKILPYVSVFVTVATLIITVANLAK